MKLLFLSKRRPQNKDLITRPFGRFYYLPKILAEKGHEVHILLLSYKNEPIISEKKDGMHWTSVSLMKHSPFSYVREAKKIIQQTKPHWIIGFSDTYFGIMAQRLGTKYNIPSLIDAYDNYESYLPWLKPLHAMWRRSLFRATLVTAAGPSLADLLGKSRPGKPTEIIPMAADPLFKSLDKVECRKKLGLPIDKKLIGYSGSTIHKSRGPHILFKAFSPPEANWLGYIPDEHMPLLMNSLDVLVVMNQPTAFGNYSYPVKLYEAMKCQIPVVVSETLSTKWIMKDKQDLLVAPDNAEKLCEKMKATLRQYSVDYGEQMDWYKVGDTFERLLVEFAEN
jgi:glycosyltransferase involved in cell wall biosynthesis